MNTAEQKYNHGLNLLLADQMARVYGESRAKAIKHAARVARDETKGLDMYALCASILAATNGKACDAVNRPGVAMRLEGLA
ncbi:hypothetical protein PR08_gp53 [Idiomarinaceae phage Phi1M2-2]|uniref:hypothetical protein n=1 Tax=Idiomarinaceae phage Phi1M2-2 TaxID=1527515 RepID=UPI0004F65FB3|nr:hypothetical protein PR08_gp53 [Idiomarinaceae phage Phi1M2-2]AIM40810.1 hypothetical protein M22_053 [Idiomarinaceae phage Phi1M2-2]